MELLLIGIYVAFCVAVFKIFRIPVNQWTLATAALGGICGLSLLFIAMAYNHPFTKNARIFFSATPILPGVKGRVIEVPVAANVPLKEGDVLFRLDPRPYQYIVNQKKAALAEAEQNVNQLKDALDQAIAATARRQSEFELAQENYNREFQLFSKNVIAQAALDTYHRNLETARQGVNEAKAAEERARVAFSSQIDGVNTTVARIQGELSDAEYDLEQTVVRAPTVGFVTQLALRPGMYVVPAPLRPVMVYVNRGRRDAVLAASFQQNSLQRVKVGDAAEVLFPAVPGRVFKGKVSQVLDIIAAGQFQATGTLQDFGATTTQTDRATAEIQILDDISAYQIPLGSTAEVAILTEHLHELSLLRRILLRMLSWQNYVFLEGHHGGGGHH